MNTPKLDLISVQARIKQVEKDLADISLHVPPRMASAVRGVLEIVKEQQVEIERIKTLLQDDGR